MAFSSFPFDADFSPSVTLDQYSCLNPFIPGLEVASSLSSDQCVFLPWSSIFDSLALLDLDPFLGNTV